MLITTNPHCFTYTSDELLIELLGGIRIDTLDRMRVTIKVTVVKRKHPQYTGKLAGLAVRHNLDLYNDVQVEMFIRRAAERLEVGTFGLSTAIADISFSAWSPPNTSPQVSPARGPCGLNDEATN